MRAVIQRVKWAKVSVEGEVVGQCGPGYMVLLAAGKSDTDDLAGKMAAKIHTLRILEDEEGKMNLSIADTGGSVLAISQFTLYGDATKQRRPSFMDAAPFERGKELFDKFVEELRKLEVPTETGIFGADMQVELLNDGPVTILLEL